MPWTKEKRLVIYAGESDTADVFPHVRKITLTQPECERFFTTSRAKTGVLAVERFLILPPVQIIPDPG